MNNWKTASSFVVFTTKGITPRYVDHSSMIVLNQKCIRNNRIDYSLAQFTDDSKKFSADKFVKKGDILVNSTGSGTAGRCAFVSNLPENYKLIVDSHILILRCTSYHEAQCLSYVLFSFEKTLMSFMTGSSGQSELDKVILLSLKTKMSDREEDQQKIASVLYALDSKIELNNKINVELAQMAKTLYDYWFIQFDFPDEKGNPYKSSGGKMVWNEELKREIPKEWKVAILNGQIEFDRGISYTTKEIESATGSPMINLASIDIDRNYRPNELKFSSNKYPERKFVKNGDLLIACTDLTRNADIIGSPIIVPKEYEKYLYSMDLARLNILSDELVDMYIYMTLRTDFYHNYIKYFASGTNVLHLDLDGILWYPTVIPPKPLQLKFANIIREFTQKQAEILNENNALSSLRDWLLPMLINGQVKVN